MAHPIAAVTFAVSFQNRLIDEADLPMALSQTGDGQPLRYPLSGALCFHDVEDHVSRIEDALEYLFFHLAGEGWRTLQATGRLHLAHWEYHGSFTIRIHDGFFTIQDHSENSVLFFEAQAVLEGLIACGRRYLDFLATLEATHPGARDERAMLAAVILQNEV